MIKFKITTEQIAAFRKAASQAESVTRGRTTLPVLKAVLLTAEKESVSIQANNLDQAIVLKVPSDVEITGQIGLSGLDLARISALGSSLEFEATDKQALIKCGGSFRLPLIDVKDFPELHSDSEAKWQTFTQAELQKVLSCGYAVSTDSQRYTLQGICFNVAAKQGVASDGRRMAISDATPAKGEWGPIVPTAAVRMMETLSKEAESLQLGFGGGNAILKTDRLAYYTRLVEGQFPSLQHIIPDPKNRITIGRENLIAAIDRVMVAQVEGERVNLSISESEMSFEAEGSNGHAQSSADLAGRPSKGAIGFKCGINPRFIREAAACDGADELVFGLVGELSPLSVTGRGFAVIMPMRTK